MEEVFEFAPAFEGKIDTGRRRRTFRRYANKAGCYIIKENGLIVYIGVSRHCLVKACYRHFYKWTCWAQKRITYVDQLEQNEYTVMIMPLKPEDALKMEQTLIITLNPRDNRERYSGVMDEILTTKGYIKAEALVAVSTENWETTNEIIRHENTNDEF